MIAYRVALLLIFAASFAGTALGLTGLLDRLGVGERVVDLDAGIVAAKRLAAARRQSENGTDVVLFVSDSLGVNSGLKGVPIGGRLQEVLRTGEPPAPLRVRAIRIDGGGAFSFYLMSEPIVEAAPALVVLSLNLRWFDPVVYGRERGDLAGWLPVGRFFEAAALPLHRIGLSPDEMLFMRGIVVSGAVDAWAWLRAEQVRVVEATREFEPWLQEKLGARGGLSFRHEGEWEADAGSNPAVGGLRSNDPVLRMLGALLARIERAGIPFLVYVAPANLAYLLSEPSALALDQTLDRIGAVVRSSGGVFLDLHDLLPTEAFADGLGHLRGAGEPDGAREVALRVAPVVRGMLARESP